MAKLHEVLAVEQGLQATAAKINQESITTFGKRDEHFVATARETTHFADEDEKLNTTEQKDMVTTVAQRLLYGMQPNIRALNAYLQRESANQLAKGDVVVDQVTIAKDVPTTVLLGLETKLADLRKVYEAIPTLQPGPTWVPDPDKGVGVYRSAHPAVTFRSKKTVKPVQLSPATEHHPAQVQAISEDIPVAKVTTHSWSGMMSSHDKAGLLERLDKLLRAVKRARMRANNTEVPKVAIGQDFFNFIHGSAVQ